MTTAPAATRRTVLRRWTLAVLGLLLFCGFLVLGTWQVQRRAWKLALIERVEQRVHAAPVALPPPGEWGRVTAAGHEYLPVMLEGRWLAPATVLVQAVTELGNGFWVMTPLQRGDGTQVWVNRGFVPEAQRERWVRVGAGANADADAPQRIEGLLRLNEPGGGFLRTNDPAQQRWYSRDVVAMGQARELSRAAPFFVDAGLPGRSAVVADGPQPGLTVIRFANSHLVYAITWYTLALMVVGAAWTVARLERRRAA
ncbi:SURF1 family protein [Hydrogenophaga sp. MI9]|uniref:SURF1 family protein n=1 Tax=Hydrogenophaga sp. MI9 TaxID=3453719 RepID=UPI003EEE8FB2